MNADRYILFSNTSEASEFISKLDSAMGSSDTWAIPNKHPFDDRAIIPWNDSYLHNFSFLITGLPQMSHKEAIEDGWIFGRIKGPFSHARAKLEEAQLLNEALHNLEKTPSLPIYKSIFFGFLGTTYAIKELIKKSCGKIGKDAEQWYESIFQKLKSDPILFALYELNNANKHSNEFDLSILRSRYVERSVSTLILPNGARMLFSNEGRIGVINEGTSHERVFTIIGNGDFEWDVFLDMPEIGVHDRATDLSDKALQFYQDWVFDARKLFGGE